MSKSSSRITTSRTLTSAAAAVLEEVGEPNELAEVAEPISVPHETHTAKLAVSKTLGSESAPRKTRTPAATASSKRFPAIHSDEGGNRQAELFYLQKQIQLQTPMVFILEDGSRIQGIVEWYDRLSIKVRGKSRVLIYKSAIKYLYKAGEVGVAPEH